MSASDPRLALLESLCEVAEDQVQAARTLDHARLGSLNLTYSDLIFELTVLLQEPVPRDRGFEKRARELQQRLAVAHARLERLSGSMVTLFGRVLSTSPPRVYTRSGRMR